MPVAVPKAEPLAIDFPNGRVLVEPNEWPTLQDGTVVLRRVRTGYRTKPEYDGLEYTLYHLAGDAHFGKLRRGSPAPDRWHQGGGRITATKIANRRKETNEMLAGIAAGFYPPKIDAVTCPRCPHFFICPAAANGPLDLTKIIPPPFRVPPPAIPS